jgi:hypothetical protein
MRRAPIAKLLSLGLLLAIPGTIYGQNDTPLTKEQKAEVRVWRIVNPLSLLGVATGSAIEQWRDHPSQWGQGGAGYARRAGASLGFVSSQNMIALYVDDKLGLDPRFHRSQNTGIWPRARDAMVQTFVATRDSGEKTLNISEFSGAYGAGFLSNAWYPVGAHGPGDALVRGSISIGYNTMSNVMKEFWPDFKRLGREKILRRHDP